MIFSLILEYMQFVSIRGLIQSQITDYSEAQKN